MTLNRTNTILAVALVMLVALTFATRVDYSVPNVEILPDMKYTAAWTAYSPNPVLPNGRTLQMPVPGTIARGQMPLHFEATKQDAVRAGAELSNPYSQSASDPVEFTESVARGAEVYQVFCVCCHGPMGAGDGPIAKRGFPPPPSLQTGNSLQMQDGQLFHILTYGQGSMSDFAGQLVPQQRWDVINYVRSLQPPPGTSATAEETTAASELNEAPQPPDPESDAGQQQHHNENQ